jgi:hypothetical protein
LVHDLINTGIASKFLEQQKKADELKRLMYAPAKVRARQNSTKSLANYNTYKPLGAKTPNYASDAAGSSNSMR